MPDKNKNDTSKVEIIEKEDELLDIIKDSFKNAIVNKKEPLYSQKQIDGISSYKDIFKVKGDVVAVQVSFPNGYGASIIRTAGSYGSKDGLFEIAVTIGREHYWKIVYNTPVTYDVVGNADKDLVIKTLREIENLRGE